MNRVLLLASGSPRRKMLLESAGWRAVVQPAHIDESVVPGILPESHATALAVAKARAVGDHPLVLAADTVVHRGGRIFDKPAHREEARAHLTALAGQWHRVTTGVCLRKNGLESTFSVTTDVRFRALDSDDIDRYLATGEADDKAGAYGIQGFGGALVAEIQGSYTNVVGLPLEEVLAALAD